jgi:hypothetical protein
LRIGIARGSSYASVLLIPRKKRVCVKLSTEAAMAGVEAPLIVAWELTVEGKEKGKERRGRGARPWGAARGAPMEGHGGRGCKGEVPWDCYALQGALCTWLLFVSEKGNRERKEKEKRREEKKRRKEKEKNMEIFLNLKIFKKINK